MNSGGKPERKNNMSKYTCPKCGKPLTALEGFCPSCGQKLEFSEAEKKRAKLKARFAHMGLGHVLGALFLEFGVPALIAVWACMKFDMSYGVAYVVSWILVTFLTSGLLIPFL